MTSSDPACIPVPARSVHPFDDISREQLQTSASRKWSLHPEAIGAWVAEMDYGTAPAVTAALHEAVAAGGLGYLAPPTARIMAEATASWLRDDNGWVVQPERIHHVSDVMAALGVAVNEFSEPDTPIIVPTPAYMPFLTYLPSIGREVIEVPGLERDGAWSHDLDGIDAAFAAGARTLVLCNPHNPTGTVLGRDELLAIAEIVERHGGRVFADEIHSPLRFDGIAHVPYASLNDVTAKHTITGMSASKAWNLPGLKTAQLITSNNEDEAQYARFGFAVAHGASTLGVVASTAAYREGREWLDEVVEYLDGNRRLLAELIDEHLPGAVYRAPDATYLAWIDCRSLGIEEPLGQFFLREAGVALTDGAFCGAGYAGHVRIVFATPAPILRDAIRAMGAAVARLRSRQ